MVSHSRNEEFVDRRHSGWNRPSPVKVKKKHPFLKFILFLILVFSLVYGWIFLLPTIKTGPSIKDTDVPITAIIDSHPTYDIGVALIDIKSGDRISLGTTKSFTAASTAKVLTAGITMHEIESSNLSMDKKLNNYPVSWHLQQMINQSNNESWAALNHYFGQEKIEAYAKKLGLKSYDYKENLLSASDMTTLLSKLYQEKLMNKEHTKLILGYMQRTNDDSFIPAIADNGNITVYHKYGWLDNYIHDAAILVKGKNKWALTIYTHPNNGMTDNNVSRDIIHAITGVVVKELEDQPTISN